MTQIPGASAEASSSAFASLGLHDALLKSLDQSGYTQPTPVQAATIPGALSGDDLMVCSATGSGKTAAFVLPSLQRLSNSPRRDGAGRGPRVLVLAPTRELVMQVAKAAETYGRYFKWLRVATVVGGVPYGAQIKAIRGALDILVATPGRLIDHLENGKLNLSNVETLVLDEADRMLDMGFVDDIHRIASATPSARQTLLFSATLGGRIAPLAAELMREPKRIELESHRERHANIEQRLHWADNRSHKERLLDRLLGDPSIDQAIVFTSTQHDAERVAEQLAGDGHAVASLHGGMPQGVRNRTLQALRRKHVRVLVATDVAARGIDVPTISHVINYGLPINAEDYVHRIGRTGRAGRAGQAITLAQHEDAPKIRRIERFTTQKLPVSTLEGLEPRFRPAPSGHGKPGGGRPSSGGRRPEGRFGNGGRDGVRRSEKPTGAPQRARRAS
ncbi:MAG: DEAD/DEAH box helicase [Betaproteobacteria bacterium]|nr:DEAD/DEAH box helicase [Betaproteobacteria bacterium]